MGYLHVNSIFYSGKSLTLIAWHIGVFDQSVLHCGHFLALLSRGRLAMGCTGQCHWEKWVTLINKKCGHNSCGKLLPSTCGMKLPWLFGFRIQSDGCCFFETLWNNFCNRFLGKFDFRKWKLPGEKKKMMMMTIAMTWKVKRRRKKRLLRKTMRQTTRAHCHQHSPAQGRELLAEQAFDFCSQDCWKCVRICYFEASFGGPQIQIHSTVSHLTIVFVALTVFIISYQCPRLIILSLHFCTVFSSKCRIKFVQLNCWLFCVICCSGKELWCDIKKAVREVK